MCSPLSALLALTFSSAPGPALETATAPSAVEPVRALAAELGTSVGLFTGGYAFAGGRWEDAYLANTSAARFLLGGFTLDGGLMSLLPLERGAPAPAPPSPRAWATPVSAGASSAAPSSASATPPSPSSSCCPP
ncbi:hypothetical protein ACLESD_03370 [Pyxidicoccus sp. 3LFB2]